MTNTIVVSTTTAQVLVTESDGTQVLVHTTPAAVVITAVTEGPQGPPGSSLSSIHEIPDVDIASALNNSVLYYDSATSVVRADSTWTNQTLADGGNF